MSSAVITSEAPIRLRKANDWIDVKAIRPPDALFDEFWREGELALMFGTAGAGKSLLAVQISDAIARGRPLPGFEMSRTRRNVLYVDLVLSDEQWAMRYSRETRRRGRRAYRFSAGLYRDRPAPGVPLVEWLRKIIAARPVRAVVIDDLSVISQTADGTRETLQLMRELRQLTRELGVSVLVLADSHPFVFRRLITERDLRGTRVLSALADSVFAIERPSSSDRRQLVQTRAQAGEPVWTHRSPVRLVLSSGDDGHVGFEREQLTPNERDLICYIKELYDDKGMSYRSIADTLDISKTTVARLYAKWTPDLDPREEGPINAEDDEAEDKEEYVSEFPEKYPGEHTDNYLAGIGMPRLHWEKYQKKLAAEKSDLDDGEVAPSDPAASEARVRQKRGPFIGPKMHKHALDGYGKEILIQKEDSLGRPDIWYSLDSRGFWRRHRRHLYGIDITRMGSGPSP